MTHAFPDNWRGLTGSHGAAEEFNASTNKATLAAWAHQLQTLADDRFSATARVAIAFASHAAYDRHDVHFRAYACMAEANRRHVTAGHDPKCGGWNLYSAALADVMTRSGHTPYRTEDDQPCTCGRG